MEQYSILNLIAHCRTGVLGHLHRECNECGHSEVLPQSCGNRHCPTCLGPRQAEWSEKVCNRLPPVAHYHVVFTVPNSVAKLMKGNPGELLGCFFRVVSEVLKKFIRNNWGGEGGFLCVLHTWGQRLQWHPHLHVLIMGGRILDRTGRWKGLNRNYSFPYGELARVYRGAFMRRLERLEATGKLQWPADLAGGLQRKTWLIKQAARKWRLHAQPALRHTRAVVRYLARYTSRAVISGRRIRQVDYDRGEIRLRYRDNRRGGCRREMTMSLRGFVAAFAQHLLPRGFQRIRYYGLLHPSRTAADQVPSAPTPRLGTPPGRRCPRCRVSNWTTTFAKVSLPGDAKTPSSSDAIATRSPPVRNRVSLLRAPPE